MLSRHKIVCIEGVIGSGKSSLLKRLQCTLIEKALFIEEPVEYFSKLITVDGENINPLEAYYKDRNCSLAMQMHV